MPTKPNGKTAANSSGYSGTPLVKKLGIKEGTIVGLQNAPKNFAARLKPWPKTAAIVGQLTSDVDLIILFVLSERVLEQEFSRLAGKLKSNGALWIAWPKKSSRLVTELSFAAVQRIGLDAGLVDVKICAIDEDWSGLKFVYRVKDRPRRKL